MHISRTFFIAAGAAALTLGLTACANEGGVTPTAATSSPSADASAAAASAAAEARASAAAEAEEALTSAQASAEAKAEAKAEQLAEDKETIQGYLDVVEDVQTALEDAKEAASDYDVDALDDLGTRFVRISFAGDDLDDIPHAGHAANKAWDSAMTNMRVAGGALQTGMYGMAAEAMADVIKDISASADALPDTL